MALQSLSSVISSGEVKGTNTVNNSQKINNITIGTGDITITATDIPFDTDNSTTVNSKINSVDLSAVHKAGDETISGNKTFSTTTTFNKVDVTGNISIKSDNDTTYEIKPGNTGDGKLAIIPNGKTIGENNTILLVKSNTKEIKIGSSDYNEVNLGFDISKDTNSDQLATTKWAMEWIMEQAVPTGTVIAFAGKNPPAGYLWCDGGEYNRGGKYEKLYNVIGETYGNGDGRNTFNVPNLKGRFIQGNSSNVANTNDVGTEKAAAIDYKHYHGFGYNTADNNGWFVAVNNSETFDLKSESGTRWWNGDSGGGAYDGDKETYDCNMITTLNKDVDNSTIVQPPAVVLNYCIKYT